MKKQFAGALLLACLFVLTGCKPVKPKDGTYRAELSAKAAEEAQGWKDYMELTYQDGKITKVAYDAIDEDGRLKSQLSVTEYPMEPHPSEWIEKMRENILKGQKSDKIEGIAGATISSKNARSLMKHIEKAAMEGDPSPSIVDTTA